MTVEFFIFFILKPFDYFCAELMILKTTPSCEGEFPVCCNMSYVSVYFLAGGFTSNFCGFFFSVAHNIYGVAQTINSANYMYFKALERVLLLDHPRCVQAFTGRKNASYIETEILFIKQGLVRALYATIIITNATNN